MTTTAVDTSVVVAALLTWHERHMASRKALEAALAGDGELVLPEHVLGETYAVLTRLPSPHRIAPAVAYEMLEQSFGKCARVATLSGRDTWRLLREASRRGIAGGLFYDARILAAARKGKADRILTLDRRDFERLDTGDVRVVVPGHGS